MNHRTLKVAGSRGSYEILIGTGLLDSLGEIACPLVQGRTVALVTDDVVDGLYAGRAAAALESQGYRVERIVVPAGETSKSWARAGELLEAMSELGLERRDCVVALGGGVIGDLAAFCAATFMRGIEVIQVPTTLLAQADSSIGGKTGVDLPRGKNLAGAFWPPVVVVSDISCLASLPESEWRSGMAEVVKSSILDGEASMALLEGDAEALGRREPEAAEAAVWMAAGLKARVVTGDEREFCAREALNYGHTLAHAIERVAGYGAISHGSAVADGMRFAAALAERIAGAEPEWTSRQCRLMDRLGLQQMDCPSDPAALLEAMHSDKKARSGMVRFVLTTAPGRWEARPVDDATLSAALSDWCRS